LEELKHFYIANFINGNGDWVGDMTGPEGEEHYKKWQKTTQALTNTFDNDIIYLLERVDGQSSGHLMITLCRLKVVAKYHYQINET
jgi:hypothetical protein